MSEDSWLSAAILARLKGQAPIAPSEALLLGNGMEEQQSRSQESDLGHDVLEAADDPDNRIDPDDFRVEAPPEQSEAWWSRLLFNPDDVPIAVQDALEALQHVAYRLGQPKPPEAVVEISQHGTMTVGALHNMIESLYGAPGWAALVECWHEAAGIVQPVQRPSHQDTAACANNNHSIAASQCSEQNTDGKPDSDEQPVTPGGFTSQARVMRWFNREEPAPPAWRDAPPPAEADDGSWVG